MSNNKSSQQKDDSVEVAASNKVRQHPENHKNIPTESAPFKLGQFEFLIWLAVMFITGGICGGFIVAAFFRSRGW